MARDKRNLHYDIAEKTEIICKHVGHGELTRSNARKIAEATDCFTFSMLDNLVKAMKEIAKGDDACKS